MELNNNFLTEEEYYDGLRKQVLDEGIFSALIKGAANILGYGSLTLFAGIGAALLAKSAVSKEGKIHRFFKRIFGKKKNLEFDYYRNKGVAKREISRADDMSQKLSDVYKAIEKKDWDEVERAFKASDYKDNTDAIKAVALKITDATGEPPLFIYPQGNQTYFICKKVLGIRYAKALAQSVLAALKQNKSYYNEITKNDLRKDNDE